MNLETAAKMLVLLEHTQQDGPEDDAYFIIHRLLSAELRKAPSARVLQDAYSDFGNPTEAEKQIWFHGNKVTALKMYRERTGAGLYYSRKALEAAEQDRSQEVLRDHEKVSGVTSCG